MLRLNARVELIKEIPWVTMRGASNAFIEKFCDECWVAMETLDYWSQQVLDMRKLFMVLPSVMQHIADNNNGENEVMPQP